MPILVLIAAASQHYNGIMAPLAQHIMDAVLTIAPDAITFQI